MNGKEEEIHNILVALLNGKEEEIYNILYKKKEIDDKTPKFSANFLIIGWTLLLFSCPSFDHIIDESIYHRNF